MSVREKTGGNGQSSAVEADDEAEAAGGRDRRADLRVQKAMERKQLRRRLIDKVTRDVETTTFQALAILDGMELNDDEAALAPKTAEVVGQKVCDTLTDKLFEGIKVAFQLGEEVGGAAVYSKAKGVIEGAAQKKEKIGAIQIRKALRRSILEASHKYSEQARARVERIPTEKIGEIGRILGTFRELDDADGDGAEGGNLREGMEEQFLERLGFPQTGPARAHDVAVQAYLVLRAELRAAKPVAEQADELQAVGKLPAEAERKARTAEDDIGQSEAVERDQAQRKRTELLTSR
jgi:hypothetical protein